VLNIQSKTKQVDIHFYVRPEYAQKVDALVAEYKKVDPDTTRGRVLEALVDFFLEHQKS